jgi:endonuclease YncB( thermonuclease family)
MRALAGTRVRLEWENPDRAEADKYGRVLAYVFNEDDDFINLQMVRLGHTAYWTKFGEGRYARQFRASELDALSPR